MVLKQALACLFAASIVVGCGNKKKDDSSGSTAGSSGGVSSSGGGTTKSDTSSAETMATASSLLEDATDAITTGSVDNGASLTDADIVRTRSCAKDANGVVTVTIATSGNGSKTVTRPKVSVAETMTASGNETRTWTPVSGQAIDCSAPDGYVKVKWRTDAVVDGLKLGVATDRSVSRKYVATNAKGVITNRESNWSAKGTRTIVFAAGTRTADVVSRTKTITQNVTRTSDSTAKDGTVISLTSAVASKEGAPLSVTEDRAVSDGSLKKKTITSGTTVATAADGSRVETTFDAVVFDLSASNADKCVPVSGTVTGGKYKDGSATTPDSTFSIAFGVQTDSGVSIAYNGGEAADFEQFAPHGCDLEKDQ